MDTETLLVYLEDLDNMVDNNIVEDPTPEDAFDHDYEKQIIQALVKCVLYRVPEETHEKGRCPVCDSEHSTETREKFYCDACGQLLQQNISKNTDG